MAWQEVVLVVALAAAAYLNRAHAERQPAFTLLDNRRPPKQELSPDLPKSQLLAPQSNGGAGVAPLISRPATGSIRNGTSHPNDLSVNNGLNTTAQIAPVNNSVEKHIPQKIQLTSLNGTREISSPNKSEQMILSTVEVKPSSATLEITLLNTTVETPAVNSTVKVTPVGSPIDPTSVDSTAGLPHHHHGSVLISSANGTAQVAPKGTSTQGTISNGPIDGNSSKTPNDFPVPHMPLINGTEIKSLLHMTDKAHLNVTVLRQLMDLLQQPTSLMSASTWLCRCGFEPGTFQFLIPCASGVSSKGSLDLAAPNGGLGDAPNRLQGDLPINGRPGNSADRNHPNLEQSNARPKVEQLNNRPSIMPSSSHPNQGPARGYFSQPPRFSSAGNQPIQWHFDNQPLSLRPNIQGSDWGLDGNLANGLRLINSRPSGNQFNGIPSDSYSKVHSRPERTSLSWLIVNPPSGWRPMFSQGHWRPVERLQSWHPDDQPTGWIQIPRPPFWIPVDRPVRSHLETRPL